MSYDLKKYPGDVEAIADSVSSEVRKFAGADSASRLITKELYQFVSASNVLIIVDHKASWLGS